MKRRRTSRYVIFSLSCLTVFFFFSIVFFYIFIIINVARSSDSGVAFTPALYDLIRIGTRIRWCLHYRHGNIRSSWCYIMRRKSNAVYLYKSYEAYAVAQNVGYIVRRALFPYWIRFSIMGTIKSAHLSVETDRVRVSDNATTSYMKMTTKWGMSGGREMNVIFLLIAWYECVFINLGGANVLRIIVSLTARR